jgi:hypothetical protein
MLRTQSTAVGALQIFGSVQVRQEVHMSEEDLEVLITLDDPGEDDLEEDTFHLPGKPNAQRTEVIDENDGSKSAG